MGRATAEAKVGLLDKQTCLACMDGPVLVVLSVRSGSTVIPSHVVRKYGFSSFYLFSVHYL